MSCKALKLSSCEIKGSTFAGRKFHFDRDISEDTFVAKVRGFYTSQTIAEIQGIKDEEGNVYFSKSTLENKPKGNYNIEYWVTFQGIATELIAVEDFKISLDACDCGDSEDSTFTLTFPEETIEYSVEIAVINIGGGGGSGADGKSAYEISVENGFVGTEAEWLISLKGEKGDVGSKGDKGEKGDVGLQGIQGVKGDKGEQGLQGLKGDKGDKGDKGENGNDGITPVKGIDYFDGEKGDKGNDGYTPIKGIDYFDGVKGDKGEQGIQGIQGLQGLKGDTGNTGLQGDQGIQGTPGVPSYTHIRYSDNAAGTGFNTTPNIYIGLANTTSPTAPTLNTGYVWYNWKGANGTTGTAGVNAYLHIRYANNSAGTGFNTTPNEYIGLANTTSATAPVVNTGYTWYKIKGEQGIQGVAGTDGTSVQVLLATSEANALTLSAANPNNIYYWT